MTTGVFELPSGIRASWSDGALFRSFGRFYPYYSYEGVSLDIDSLSEEDKKVALSFKPKGNT